MELKPIPQNTVVHTPAEAEAKELLAILHENGWITNGNENYAIKNAEGIQIDSDINWSWWEKIENARKENHAILTLAEFKAKYVNLDDTFTDDCKSTVKVEKPQPKFSKGDKVIVVIDDYHLKEVVGGVCEITEVLPHGYYMESPTGKWFAVESDLEPYTDPETKDESKDESKETKGKESGKIGNNSENSQLDLCELLKGHEGETFFHLMYGECVLEEIDPHEKYSICLKDKTGQWAMLPSCGHMPCGLVILFPSRALYEQYPLDPYTAWMKWQEKQNLYHIRISFQTVDGIEAKRCSNFHSNDLGFRTPADRDKCLDEIKAVIEKYNKRNDDENNRR